MTYALWNLGAQSDAAPLRDALEQSGFVIRQVDTEGVQSAQELWDRCGQAFRFQGGGWDSFADDMWSALLPDDDEPNKVAFVWHHADALLDGGLGVLLDVFDVLIRTGRGAYAEGLEVISFLLGDGPNFPPIDVAEMFTDATD